MSGPDTKWDARRAKRAVQSLAQRALGFERYLRLFAMFKVRTLHRDSRESDVLRFARLLPDDGVVLDIGANVGIMTVHLARAVPRGRVHSFEPMPENFSTLGWMVDHYGLGNVSLHQLALGDSEGELEMVMPEEDSVRMQGLSRVVGANDRYPEGRTNVVPVKRLDDLNFLEDVDVAGIKIDVEDFEEYVFAGGRKLMSRCLPPVYTELGGGENRRNCIAFFEDLGYSVCVADGERIVPHVEGAHSKHNFFMMPPGHPGRPGLG
jgi:FkbM family methyltransferase